MSQEQIITTQNKINELTQELQKLEQELIHLQALPENNKFSDMKVAERAIEAKLEVEAEMDCEGKYNCGNPQYTQEFYVNDVLYIGILDVEYNRHDKTYYYVEESTFTVKKLGETNDV